MFPACLSLGQVGGVAISSSIFQSNLEYNLGQRIHGPDAAEVCVSYQLPGVTIQTDPDVFFINSLQTILKIRQNARIIGTLEPHLQQIAKDSYNLSLHRVFFFAAVSTLLAYLVRLPVSLFCSHARTDVSLITACCSSS